MPGIRGVRAHARGGVTVLFVAGSTDGFAGELDRAVGLALADEPRAVICDVSDVTEGPDTLGSLSRIGSRVDAWPGTPVFVVAAAPLRSRLQDDPGCRRLVVVPSLHEALGAADRVMVPPTATRELAPHPTAARAARDFLTGCLLDWKAPKALAAGSLVMSELVTNAMIYADTDIRVSVARHEEWVRIAVRDGGAALPEQRGWALESTHGRGLVIVDGFARAWGVLPCADSGKVVWAVVEG